MKTLVVSNPEIEYSNIQLFQEHLLFLIKEETIVKVSSNFIKNISIPLDNCSLILYKNSDMIFNLQKLNEFRSTSRINFTASNNLYEEIIDNTLKINAATRAIAINNCEVILKKN
jgi:hypothetical protein